MNKHREIIYKRRRRLLEQSEDLREEVIGYIHDEIESTVNLRAPQHFSDDEFDAIIKEFIKIIPFDERSQAELKTKISKLESAAAIIDTLQEIVESTYASREEVAGPEQMRQLEKIVTLTTIDEKWMDHLDEMDSLREGIWLRGDKNTVLSEYKKEAFTMFDALISQVESAIANRIFRVHLQQQPRSPMQPQRGIEIKESVNEPLAKEVQDATLPQSKAATPASRQGSNSDLASALASAKVPKKATPGVSTSKVGRNDPCPCGSGLKYKKCGLINSTEHQARMSS